MLETTETLPSVESAVRFPKKIVIAATATIVAVGVVAFVLRARSADSTEEIV